jgi:hypothetical protein
VSSGPSCKAINSPLALAFTFPTPTPTLGLWICLYFLAVFLPLHQLPRPRRSPSTVKIYAGLGPFLVEQETEGQAVEG